MAKTKEKRLIERMMMLMNLDDFEITPGCDCGPCSDKKAVMRMADESPEQLEKLIDDCSEEFQAIMREDQELHEKYEEIMSKRGILGDRLRKADAKFLNEVHAFLKRIELN